MVTRNEAFCLVVYDVPDDAIRHRFSETCLDYGLERFQMSAFWGYLASARRKELFVRLRDFLGKAPGRILVQPVGADDFERRYVLHQKSTPPGEAEPEVAAKKHFEFAEPGANKPTIVKL